MQMFSSRATIRRKLKTSFTCYRSAQESGNNEFKILQWNCNGISRKVKELVEFMDKRGILTAELQETKPSSRNPLSCSSSYNVIRKYREINKGGGIASLIHSSANFRPLDIQMDSIDDRFEIQGIAVRSAEVEIEIFNIHILPMAACHSGYNPSLDFLLAGQNRIILGS